MTVGGASANSGSSVAPSATVEITIGLGVLDGAGSDSASPTF
jgi:hypothetical protein